MEILITGFAPFNGEKINPSFEAVKKLPDKINDINITKLEVPVSYLNGYMEVYSKIKNTNYDAIILVGQAGGRNAISLEKVAINYCYANILDNDGLSLNHSNIYNDGADAYFTTLPIIRMERALKEMNIKAQISFTCGTYVCNDLMYRVLHYIKNTNQKTKAGFIHVPYIKEQVEDKENMPYMELDEIIKALKVCIVNAMEEEDIIWN